VEGSGGDAALEGRQGERSESVVFTPVSGEKGSTPSTSDRVCVTRRGWGVSFVVVQGGNAVLPALKSHQQCHV